VGARCRECAQLRKLPQFEVSPLTLARGAGAGVGLGLVLGFLWGVILPLNLGIFFGALAGAGIGYAVGEAVSLATNRKAGPPLQAIAAAGVVVAYLVRSAILASALRDFGIGFVDVVTGDLGGYIAVGLGIVIAIGRVRF
jgi:hypothetical protein